jgi:ABC-type multidrug transport system fused ATPase/permease subunit
MWEIFMLFIILFVLPYSLLSLLNTLARQYLKKIHDLPHEPRRNRRWMRGYVSPEMYRAVQENYSKQKSITKYGHERAHAKRADRNF